MKATIILAAASLVSGIAVANPKPHDAEVQDVGEAFGLDGHDDDDNSGSTRRKGACSKLELTAEQKTELRGLMFEYAKDKTKLDAAKKLAKLEYAETVLKSDADIAQATTAGSEVVAAERRLLTSKVDFTNRILFDVVTAEQRPAAYLCLKAIERYKHGHKKHHRHGH